MIFRSFVELILSVVDYLFSRKVSLSLSTIDLPCLHRVVFLRIVLLLLVLFVEGIHEMLLARMVVPSTWLTLLKEVVVVHDFIVGVS